MVYEAVGVLGSAVYVSVSASPNFETLKIETERPPTSYLQKLSKTLVKSPYKAVKPCLRQTSIVGIGLPGIACYDW